MLTVNRALRPKLMPAKPGEIRTDGEGTTVLVYKKDSRDSRLYEERGINPDNGPFYNVVILDISEDSERNPRYLYHTAFNREVNPKEIAESFPIVLEYNE